MIGHHAFLLPQSYDEIMRLISQNVLSVNPCADLEGGGGSGPLPHEKSQKIEFLSNTGPDALKTTKLPGQHSMF